MIASETLLFCQLSVTQLEALNYRVYAITLALTSLLNSNILWSL